MIDWRLPENRREAFQRSYTFHLKHKAHPGMVYSFLPAIAEAFDLDDEGRAWLVWLNGNTQNAVTSLMLLEAAPRPEDWKKAIDFWNEHFKKLEWDTDRRHQKSKFGIATENWMFSDRGAGWSDVGMDSWQATWEYSKAQPYMGRLSAWSMMEYARILLPGIPDIGTFMLADKTGSQSHRNSVCFIAGYASVYWPPDAADALGIVPEMTYLAEDLLLEAEQRNAITEPDGSGWKTELPHPDVSRLTMESALCTYKSWHKPNRRYPGCYADMMYNRIRKAEARFGRSFPLLWETRQRDLPEYLRLEDCPNDPGLAPIKQNHYLEYGCPVMLHHDWPEDMDDGFMSSPFPLRKDPSW